MKIYNEIISTFNEQTGQWDTLFEDSEEYNGPMMLCSTAAWIQKINLGTTFNANVSAGSVWITGNTKAARLIHKESLDIDFTLTGMLFQCHSAVGVNDANPGIIRVYQEGLEGAAATLEVKAPVWITQAFNLDILGALGSRVVIIDAFDPASSSPNNLAQFSGSITLMGKPKIVELGATSSGSGAFG